MGSEFEDESGSQVASDTVIVELSDEHLASEGFADAGRRCSASL